VKSRLGRVAAINRSCGPWTCGVAVGKIVGGTCIAVAANSVRAASASNRKRDRDESASPDGDRYNAYGDCPNDRHVRSGRRWCNVCPVGERGLHLGRVECYRVDRRRRRRSSDRARDDRMRPISWKTRRESAINSRYGRARPSSSGRRSRAISGKAEVCHWPTLLLTSHTAHASTRSSRPSRRRCCASPASAPAGRPGPRCL
jgi:hypothetical protein